jgi:ABC-type bacteriocin/lantibiotic exporter with double-glycine peptidase domain
MEKLKTIFATVPSQYRGSLRTTVLFSAIGLILDFVSVVLLVPVFAGLFDSGKATAASAFLPQFFKEQPALLIIAVAVFFILKNALSASMVNFQTSFYYRLANALSVNLLRNYFNKSLEQVKAEKNSALVKDMIFIPTNFVNYVLSSLLQLISETLLLLMILITSFLINPQVMLLLVIMSLATIGGMYLYEKNKLKIIDQNFTAHYNRNFSNILNAVNGYAEIKISRTESYFMRKFNDSNAALNEMHRTLTVDRLIKPRYTETFLVLIISGLYLFSVYFATDYNLLFVSFLFAACIKIIPSVNRILIALTNLKSNMHTVAVLKNCEPVLDQPTKPLQPIVFKESIGLTDINFAFGTLPLLKNVSLKIPKGSIIGIFGDSGNGKSTLINIISTLIKANSGQLHCDGTVITETNRDAYLSLVAYVPQAPFIVEGSITENLFLDGILTNQSLLDYYLELFELKETIAGLPSGLDTFIGSNGFTLSGGQIQRLAIIRALLRNPELLLLDEATNQLDGTLRNKIMESLKAVSKSRKLTIISISHNRAELDHFCDVTYELKDAILS